MDKPRYLTKTRFKTGLSCPTKLFYTGKKEYLNSSLDDPFLEALADGGYQVGALAKKYYPGGVDLELLHGEEAVNETQKLMARENVIIYEAAIRFSNLLVRIDVLIKLGNTLKIVEVKSKTYDPSGENTFVGKRGSLVSGWKEYLYDVAFQQYVLKNAYPKSRVESYFMLCNKRAICSADGLNQKFEIRKDEGSSKGIVVSDKLTEEDIKTPILIEVPLKKEIELIVQEVDDRGQRFEDKINFLSDRYSQDIKIPPQTGMHCKTCEFKCSSADEGEGYKSGFKECWKQVEKWDDSDFEIPTVFDVWNFRGAKKLLEEGKIKFTELTEDDFKLKEATNPGLSSSQRQWLQVEMYQANDDEPYLDVASMKAEMESWTYPLNFIDFETSTAALPFTKGRKPYETTAFQFSHHTVDKEGVIKHAGEFIAAEKGLFPNIDFIRALKSQLEGDEGTIFRYATHENTVLNHIYMQIESDKSNIEDADDLQAFIRSITYSADSSKGSWSGERKMVDMLELVKRFYYHPKMKGSNSIKFVLPAVLNSSAYLKRKYSEPLYGASDGIHSYNFKDHTWVTMVGGEVVDPYKQLPKLFQDVSDHDFDILSDNDLLANGGAAMTAYGKLQFETISDYERAELKKGLLKYCELDTMAMVMIYEGWKELVKSA